MFNKEIIILFPENHKKEALSGKMHDVL